MNDPVLITGYGWVSPLGNDKSSFDAQLFGGHRAVSAHLVELPGQEVYSVPVCICDVDTSAVKSPSKIPLDRGAALAIKAARSALLDAGLAKQSNQHLSDENSIDLELSSLDATRVGVFWGCGMGGAYSFDQSAAQIYQHGKRPRPTTVITTMPNSAAAELSLLINAQGASMT